jgi:hypothetical protein
MNSTRTLAIVAVLTAATLVVGGTSAAMTTGHSAFAWKQDSYKDKRGDDSYKDKRGDDRYKKVKQANGNYGNGNTNTAQILNQNAKADKFSIVEQNGENSICTHPSSSSPDSTDLVERGSNASCTSQSNQPPFGVS